MKAHLKAGITALSLLTATVFAADIRIDGYPDYDTQINAIKSGLPQHNITMLKNNHGDHHNKLKTNLATGTGAGDVVLIDVGFVGSFVNAGGFVDLTDWYTNASDYASYAVEAGKGSDGAQYAVPVDLGPGVMYYRRDYMEDMGFDLDEVMTDWDTYIEYGRKLKEKGILLIGDAGALANAYYRFNTKEGEGLYFDADGKSLVTSERFVRAFEIAKEVRDGGMDGQISEWTEDWYAGFREGKFATQMSGAWLLGHLKNWIAPDTSGLWGVSNLPAGTYGSWGGSYLAIPKQAKNPEASWDLIEYMISEDIQLAGFKNIAAFPAHTGTYEDPSFAEPIEFLRGQKARLLFAEIVQNVTPVTPMKGDLIAEDLINQALEKVLNDGEDIEKALNDVEKQLKRRVR
jgi:multiple sugar transport system substrate-binding protein